MPVEINATTLAIAGLLDLWAETVGEPQICVAVLDGWVDCSHPSLAEANLTQRIGIAKLPFSIAS